MIFGRCVNEKVGGWIYSQNLWHWKPILYWIGKKEKSLWCLPVCKVYGYNRNYHYGYPDGNILIPAIRGEVRFHLGAMLIDKKVIDENKLQYTEGCLIGQDLEFMLKVAVVATFKAVYQNLLMYRVRHQRPMEMGKAFPRD
jgi:hypothetical protein